MKTKLEWGRDDNFNFAVAADRIFGGTFREPFGDGLYVGFIIADKKDRIFAPCSEDRAKQKVESEFKNSNRKR
jgi:hypothetical protein